MLKEQFQGIAWPEERATCDVHVPWEQCLSFPNAATPATQPLTRQPPELGWTPGPGTNMLSDPSWSNSFSKFVLSTYYCARILGAGVSSVNSTHRTPCCCTAPSKGLEPCVEATLGPSVLGPTTGPKPTAGHVPLPRTPVPSETSQTTAWTAGLHGCHFFSSVTGVEDHRKTF